MLLAPPDARRVTPRMLILRRGKCLFHNRTSSRIVDGGKQVSPFRRRNAGEH
jgi:hypothetical protein